MSNCCNANNLRIKSYNGWANYYNVKSGDYNRQKCWKCGDLKGFPQTPGLYNLNIVNPPQPTNNYITSQNLQTLQNSYNKLIQSMRMANDPGSYSGPYVNYLNEECHSLYPKRYVKGNWPDEQLIYTNTPK